ncbi:hypothetical protein JW948_17805 [bacterium]|nr:hypothetical protein [bacterium]
MKRFTVIFLLQIMMLLPILNAQEKSNFKLIVNDKNPISEISRDNIAGMFLKNVLEWENGSRILPVDQTEENSIRAQFSESVLEKSVGSIKSFWRKQLFSGINTPPIELSGDNDVIDYVRNNPGAIGYVMHVSDTKGIKIVRINK